MSRRRDKIAPWTCAALLLAVAPASGQIPDSFTNLKVLPEDIAKPELIAVMRGIATGLGQRCEFCHVGENTQTLEDFDFAADDKEHKRIARHMMRMVDAINGELVPAAGLENPVRVECVTCHRGVAKPQALDDLLLAVIEDDGVEAAAARYRELRETYYGRGAYDFGPGTLSRAAEALAAREEPRAALTLVRLGLEHDPHEARLHYAEGQLLLTLGEAGAALASVRRAVELAPEVPWFASQLARFEEAARAGAEDASSDPGGDDSEPERR